ncbi:hypothetical protein GBAR_LOCUS27952 [Geodia barretti]|uniref:Uncharacterized protein n=1 Tax=Geodia barretti TaxID=519541 RepID=A0AA35XB48_GEOBA|nr:hypothetical protein GBAR_LOCUS27952 [Geodia barretti]
MEYQPGTLRELLMAVCDLRLRNKEGLTALMIADKSDRTDITNILQQADLGNKENLCGRKGRQPALCLPVEVETQPLLKCSRQALMPAKRMNFRAEDNGLTSGYSNHASAARKSQRVPYANKSPLRIKTVCYKVEKLRV